MSDTFRHKKQGKIKRKLIKYIQTIRKYRIRDGLIANGESGCYICDPEVGKMVKRKKLEKLIIKEINEEIGRLQKNWYFTCLENKRQK